MHTKENTSAQHVRKRLLASKEAYVESVGKEDIATLGTAVNSPGGKGNVIRLILGATVQMPLRAITYADSAIRVAQMLPCEQLQIIHANHLGSRINGTDRAESRRQALLLALTVSSHIQNIAPQLAGRLLHAEDTPLDVSHFLPLSESVLIGSDIGKVLQAKGAKHGGDAIAYAAAHSAFQDTDRLELAPLLSGQPDQIRPDRIISVGCQQERTFYLARMAMRKMNTSISMLPTAQIFTRHVTPPYFMARGGEQGLEDALEHGLNFSLAVDPSTQRDLQHVITLTSGAQL